MKGNNKRKFIQTRVGRCSSVGIATGYGLDSPGIESRWGTRFFAPVQTGPGVHPASCTMSTGSFPGVKSGRGVMLTPHPLLERVELYLFLPMGRTPQCLYSRAIPLLPLLAVRPVQSPSACTKVHFTLLYLIRTHGNRLNGDFRPSFGNLL